jgi:hypothetical protein
MDISSLNASTPGILMQAGEMFDVSVSGTFVATVTLQRSKDNATWLSVEDITAPLQKSGVSGSAWYYRLTTTVYSSGTVLADLFR